MRLGRSVLAFRVLQGAQIVEARRHIRMHRSELLLAQRQASFREWNGLGKFALLGELFDLLPEAVGLGEVLGPRRRCRLR